MGGTILGQVGSGCIKLTGQEPEVCASKQRSSKGSA